MTVHELYLLHLGQLAFPSDDPAETHFAQVPGYLIRTATGVPSWSTPATRPR
jgi:hypothetical protein